MCWRQVDTREREKDTDRDWFIAKSYFQQTPGLIAQTGNHKYKSPQRITQCLVRLQRCAQFNWILLKMEHFHVNSSPYQSNIYVYIYIVCVIFTPAKSLWTNWYPTQLTITTGHPNCKVWWRFEPTVMYLRSRNSVLRFIFYSAVQQQAPVALQYPPAGALDVLLTELPDLLFLSHCTAPNS
jgi:hypothetical protein